MKKALKSLFGISLVLVVASCAVTDEHTTPSTDYIAPSSDYDARIEKFEAALSTWVGAPADALISSWGIPERSLDLGHGGKVFEFVSGWRLGKCTTSFTTNSEGIVTHWTWKGASQGACP